MGWSKDLLIYVFTPLPKFIHLLMRRGPNTLHILNGQKTSFCVVISEGSNKEHPEFSVRSSYGRRPCPSFLTLTERVRRRRSPDVTQESSGGDCVSKDRRQKK